MVLNNLLIQYCVERGMPLDHAQSVVDGILANAPWLLESELLRRDIGLGLLSETLTHEQLIAVDPLDLIAIHNHYVNQIGQSDIPENSEEAQSSLVELLEKIGKVDDYDEGDFYILWDSFGRKSIVVVKMSSIDMPDSGLCALREWKKRYPEYNALRIIDRDDKDVFVFE